MPFPLSGAEPDAWLALDLIPGLGGEGLQQALGAVLEDVSMLGGKGGLIAVAPTGEAAWGFTTRSMYRGVASADGRTVAIYSDADER